MSQQPPTDQHTNHPRSRPFSYQIPSSDDPSDHGTPTTQPPPLQTSTSAASGRIPPDQPTVEIPYNERYWGGFPQQRFSYVETPIEDSTQEFDSYRAGTSSRPGTSRSHQQHTQMSQPGVHTQPIEESDISHAPTPQPAAQHQSQFPAEKHGPERMPSAYQLNPPEQTHPAHSAPYAEEEQDPLKVQPPNSPGPLPYKSPEEERAASTISPPNPSTSPHPPPDAYNSVSAFVPPPGQASAISPPTANLPSTNSAAAPFSPYAPDITSSHRPGQIPHPNMAIANGAPTGNSTHKESYQSTTDRPWLHSLCACPPSDMSTCLLGLTCPCILYSRLLHRLSQRAHRRDPTDLLGFSRCNGHCLGFAALCVCGGLSGLLAAIATGRVRDKYNVAGSWAGDLGKGCCCCCCTVIQGEREVRGREQERGRWAGPTVDGLGMSGMGGVSATAPEGYARVEGMKYAPASGAGG